MIFRALQLGIGHRHRFDTAQFLDDQVDHLSNRFVRTAGVDGERARVAVGTEAAEHRIGEAALFADVLEQPRAHRATEQRIQHVARIASVVILRIAADTDAEVTLFELFVANQDLRHDLRRLVSERFARFDQRPEFLIDQIAHAVVFQVADGGHDQVPGGIGVAEIGT